MNLKVSTVTHGGEQLSKAAFLVIQTALQGTLQGRHGYFMVVVYRFACLLYGTKFPESSIAPGTQVHCLTKTGKLLTSH